MRLGNQLHPCQLSEVCLPLKPLRVFLFQKSYVNTVSKGIVCQFEVDICTISILSNKNKGVWILVSPHCSIVTWMMAGLWQELSANILGVKRHNKQGSIKKAYLCIIWCLFFRGLPVVSKVFKECTGDTLKYATHRGSRVSHTFAVSVFLERCYTLGCA